MITDGERWARRGDLLNEERCDERFDERRCEFREGV